MLSELTAAADHVRHGAGIIVKIVMLDLSNGCVTYFQGDGYISGAKQDTHACLVMVKVGMRFRLMYLIRCKSIGIDV